MANQPSPAYPPDLNKQCEIMNKDYQWVVVPAVQVLKDIHRYRCMHCHGQVRLHDQQVEHGPHDHVEHIEPDDSKHCIAGIHFRRMKKDPSEHRLSRRPVQ